MQNKFEHNNGESLSVRANVQEKRTLLHDAYQFASRIVSKFIARKINLDHSVVVRSQLAGVHRSVNHKETIYCCSLKFASRIFPEYVALEISKLQLG